MNTEKAAHTGGGTPGKLPCDRSPHTKKNVRILLCFFLWPAMQAHLSWQRPDDKDKSGLSPHQPRAFCPDIILYIHLHHQPLCLGIELHHTAKIVIVKKTNLLLHWDWATCGSARLADKSNAETADRKGCFNTMPAMITITKHKHSPGLKWISGDTNLRSKTEAGPAITNWFGKRIKPKKADKKSNQIEKRFQIQALATQSSTSVGDEFESRPRTDLSEVNSRKAKQVKPEFLQGLLA